MNPVYIKVENNEAISSKKNILTAEAGILNIIKKLENYKILRKKELAKKSELKTRLADLKATIKKLNLQHPETRGRIEEYAETRLQLSKKTSIESELNEIREKLKRLS